MKGVACRAASGYKATCTERCAGGPQHTETTICSDTAACQAAHELSPTCTECCIAAPWHTEKKICSYGAALDDVYGCKATCTKCCAVDPQWAAQWRSWRCPGKCWLSALLHTAPQCPQVLSCTQGHICSMNIQGSSEFLP